MTGEGGINSLSGALSDTGRVVKFLRVRIKICVQLKFADLVMEAL